MYRSLSFFILLSVCISVNSQTIDLRGKVTNQNGQPIENAIITLVGQDLKDTTGSDGTYEITRQKIAVSPQLLTYERDAISMHGNFIEFSLPAPSPVKVELFDAKGNLLKKEISEDATAGLYHFNISEMHHAVTLLFIRASIGNETTTFRYLPLNRDNYAPDQLQKQTPVGKNALMKITAINDTITITADGYKGKSVSIDSYEQELDVTLNADNGSTGSLGCGKDLSDLKNGTYKITSAGLEREYIIDIPSDYDKDKPCRLIFGMHCMGSSMQGVVGENYYSLKPLAQKDNVPVIFVAPQGYTDNSPWRVSDNKDHIFFEDMLKLFKEDLCVDTTRIFCCGFSYGAMVSYSISTAFQDQLRAVATYAPANWNIWLPTNNHKPIAYYQTTGTGDNLCSWVNSDARKEGGKYCVLQHLEDNGCPAPADIPLANSGTHVSTEFSGCPEEYPVIFASHNGGHQGTASDQGSNVNWIAKETWEFFMRF
jgi:poly(3-hydroxybutyrate) depolymerase